MDPYRIGLIEERELLSAFHLLRGLRPHLDESEFRRVYDKAKAADSYRFIGLWKENVLIGLMGIRDLHDYVHGSHWYVDDLVVDSGHRSKGYGARLLGWLEDEAKTQGIGCLRLSTGTQNQEGMKFYEREGWEIRSVTYKKFPLQAIQ